VLVILNEHFVNHDPQLVHFLLQFLDPSELSLTFATIVFYLLPELLFIIQCLIYDLLETVIKLIDPLYLSYRLLLVLKRGPSDQILVPLENFDLQLLGEGAVLVLYLLILALPDSLAVHVVEGLVQEFTPLEEHH
jgi:hypothetical protein